MSELAHEMGCSCKVYKFPKDRGKFRLVYCPMHEAAPTLLEALERIDERAHQMANGGGAQGKPTMGEIKAALRAMRDQARAAIAQVKGETA